MKHENAIIEIKDPTTGKVIRTLRVKDYMDELMANDHKLVTEVRTAVIFG